MIQTNIDFPNSLPCFLHEGYDINHAQPFFRTTMVSGRARQRRKFTSVPSMINVSLLCDGAQAQAFEAWFRDAIHDGADWFNAIIKTPLGLHRHACRFVDMYSGPKQTGKSLWRFSATLEAWDRPLLPPGWGELPDFVAGMSIFDIAMNREWPLHDDNP